MNFFLPIVQVGLGLFVCYIFALLAWLFTMVLIGFIKSQGRVR